MLVLSRCGMNLFLSNMLIHFNNLLSYVSWIQPSVNGARPLADRPKDSSGYHLYRLLSGKLWYLYLNYISQLCWRYHSLPLRQRYVNDGFMQNYRTYLRAFRGLYTIFFIFQGRPLFILEFVSTNERIHYKILSFYLVTNGGESSYTWRLRTTTKFGE